jgi:hypothetical protein
VLQDAPGIGGMLPGVIDRIAAILGNGPRFAWLIREYRLDPFESVALLIALAPEVDLRYQRIYAYLQDDVTRKRPTVDLILNLLCPTDRDRLSRRRVFASDSVLIRNDLVHCVPDPNYVSPPLLAQYVKPDEQIVRLLAGDGGLDSRLAKFARLVEPAASLDELPLSDALRKKLAAVAQAEQLPPLWLHGPAGVRKAETAETIAARRGGALVAFDASQLDSSRFQELLRLAIREAAFRGATLYIAGVEAAIHEPRALQDFAGAVRNATCSLIIGSTQAVPAAVLGLVLPLALTVPSGRVRSTCWRKTIARTRFDVKPQLTNGLGARFSLTPAQIDAAVAAASLQAQVDNLPPDFFAAARAQCGEALGGVADKIVPRATWQDLVLPDDSILQLRELCQRVEYRDRVLEEWGFGRKLSRGRGTAALFSGGSGTGKTMAAEVIANQLGLDLYRIDLARVVSKYIGETEKNLARVFEAAEAANAILFFDEAEALFGKRSEVKDARDRYANIEVAYLLQRIEDYEGIAILASNLVESMDDAMCRRLAFHVHFPFPDETMRLRLWERAWSSETPLAAAVDRRSLARDLRLSGGSIRNVALAAAFLAAADGGVVHPSHVGCAVRREQQKHGRSTVLPQSLVAEKA